MTGWCVGYVVGEEGFIKEVVKFQQNIAVCVATPNQYAAIEAMTNADRYASGIKDVFAKRRETLMKELDKIDKISCKHPTPF